MTKATTTTEQSNTTAPSVLPATASKAMRAAQAQARPLAELLAERNRLHDQMDALPRDLTDEETDVLVAWDDKVYDGEIVTIDDVIAKMALAAEDYRNGCVLPREVEAQLTIDVASALADAADRMRTNPPPRGLRWALVPIAKNTLRPVADATAQETWQAAKARYEAANAAHEACDDEADDKAGSPIWNEWRAALSEWEELTPPSLTDLADLLRVQIGTYFLDYNYQDADCPNTISDLLVGDAEKATIAATYLSLLRFADIDSPALSATVYEPFDESDHYGSTPDERVRAWREHHERRVAGAATTAELLAAE